MSKEFIANQNLLKAVWRVGGPAKYKIMLVGGGFLGGVLLCVGGVAVWTRREQIREFIDWFIFEPAEELDASPRMCIN